MVSTDKKPEVIDNTWKRVIIINGPPGVGKDTAAGAIMAFIVANEPWKQPRLLKIAEPIKKAAHMLFGLDSYSWDHYDKEGFQKHKDVPCGEFLGDSPRTAYIAISDYAKSKFGEEFFGWIARRKMAAMKTAGVFVLDGGIAEELPPVIDYVGAEHVLILEIHSVGKTFENDSRGYIGEELKDKYPNIKVQRVFNEFSDDIQDRELFKIYCKGAAKKFLNIEEKDYDLTR